MIGLSLKHRTGFRDNPIIWFSQIETIPILNNEFI